jgi:hypothetical protein
LLTERLADRHFYPGKIQVVTKIPGELARWGLTAHREQ